MSDLISQSPEEWRNYTVNIPIAACRLGRNDLKALYKIIDDKQKQYRDRFLTVLVQQPSESAEVFSARQQKVKNCFVTSVSITATNGEIVTGNNEEFFNGPNIPSSIRSVFYSTQSVPQAVIQHQPADRITVFLDFSRRPLLDFQRQPTLPTPNESNFQIAANLEPWFTSAKSKLNDFFQERKSGFDWLHRSAVYDVLLFVFGIPWALWNDHRLSKFVELGNFPAPLSYGTYIYIFLFSLIIFRVLFSYSRWVFPKIEIESIPPLLTSPLRHRAVWAAILLAAFGGPAYDLIKLLFIG